MRPLTRCLRAFHGVSVETIVLAKLDGKIIFERVLWKLTRTHHILIVFPLRSLQSFFGRTATAYYELYRNRRVDRVTR